MNEYPQRCPSCGALDWEDLDMDSGEVFCYHCGAYFGEEDENH